MPSLGVGGIGGAKFCEIEVCAIFQHFAYFLSFNIIYSISKTGCNVVMRLGLCTDNNEKICVIPGTVIQRVKERIRNLL